MPRKGCVLTVSGTGLGVYVSRESVLGGVCFKPKEKCTKRAKFSPSAWHLYT